MKTLFLSSIIVLGALIAYESRKHRKMQDRWTEDFWTREARANNTRKKSLDYLHYITIPFEDLPMDTMRENSSVQESHTILHELSTQKIVNFTGYTNTDLKLKYGTANITELSQYDQNYTYMVRALQTWAEALYLGGFEEETRIVLEFAVSTGTDMSHSYYILADIYDSRGESAKKAALIEAAENLRSSMRKVIARTLKESGPYSGWLHSS